VLCLCADRPAVSRDGIVLGPLPVDACERVLCSCAPAKVRSRARAAARPADQRPADRRPAEEPLPPPVQPDGPALDPAPEAGFLLEPRRLGLRVEAGWPFFGAQVAYGAHDAVEVALGYRGVYGLASAFYGGARFRLHENPKHHAAVSLLALGGYTYVAPGESHNRSTRMAGGDSGFGEASLALSIGGARAWFTFAGGARISGVQGHDCGTGAPSDSNCSQAVIDDGDAGFLVTVMLEVGFAVRLISVMSLFGTVGADWFANSDASPAFVRGRLGFVFDIETRRRRR
jgi:hypothetical protein